MTESDANSKGKLDYEEFVIKSLVDIVFGDSTNNFVFKVPEWASLRLLNLRSFRPIKRKNYERDT